MIREVAIKAIRERPQTLEQLAVTTGVPCPVLRSTLAAEFYRQAEVIRKEGGKATDWAVNGRCRIRVNSKGVYFLVGA